MLRQTRLSKLTLAATIIVAASATSFAQTESTKSRTEATSDVAIAMNAPKAIERIDTGSVATTVAVASVSTPSPSFSAAKFMAAVNQSASDISLTTAPRTDSELRFAPKFELGSEEFTAPTKTPRITFVPSRGQKLPTQ